MRDSQNVLSGKRKYLYGSILLLFISVICAAFNRYGNEKFDISRREVLLRKIGDDLLSQSGDLTSRVLPVKKIAENEYQIGFENALTFKPDSLVNTTRRLLAKDPLTHDYIVNVLNCGNASVAYGFAISGNEKDNIVPCSGRVQPRACYILNIQFKPMGMNTAQKGYLFGGLPFLAFVGFIFLRSARQRTVLSRGKIRNSEGEMTSREGVTLRHSKRGAQRPFCTPLLPHVTSNDQCARMFTFGSVLFNAQERQLIINKKAIDLTGTETRLLLIFALSPNQTIARSRLQKEIWEDEGVIVGRSLDMFISKLRKKLEIDPKVKIVNIRSKGYKLEIMC